MKNDKLINAIQEAKKKVGRALLSNQSMLVYDLQQKDYESFEYNSKIHLDSVLNYGYEDRTIEFLQENHDFKGVKLTQEIYDEFEDKIIDFLQCNTDIMYDLQEYYEAWLVDSWLFVELEQRGELTIDYKGTEQWWGRACTGQSIQLDYIIQEIVVDLAAIYSGIEKTKVWDFLKRNNYQTFNL